MESTDKILERVQKLIAKAEGTDSPAEAEAFFDKANALMLQHSIDEAMLEAKRPADQKIKPIRKDGIFICEKGNHLESQLGDLATTLAVNFGVRIIFYGLGKQSYWKNVTVTAIGFESDIRFFVTMLTALHLDLSSQLTPKPDVGKSFDENVYTLHEAGVSWRNIVYAMQGARPEGSGPEWPILSTWDEPDVRASGGKCKTAYRRECKRRNEAPRKIQSPVTYQRNFAQGYSDRVGARLYKMRARAEQSSAPGTALVLRREDVDAAYESAFPDRKQHKSARVPMVARAYGEGQQAGERADLNTNRAAAGKRDALQ